MKKSLLLAVMLVMCGSVIAQPKSTDPLPSDPAVRTGTLPNGLKYYIRKNAKPEHRMELRLAVKTGSTMENDDQQGLAHFCEHMQFNGLKHFPKMDLVNFLEATGVRFGAHLNAYTSFDETVYMLQLPTDSPKVVDKGMLVMQDWAGNATLDQDEIDKERGVVLEEWRLGRGAQERVQKVHLPIEYANSRYALRLPIGKPDVIEHCSYETLRSFYHTWYRPDLMAFVAVGDFDIDKMEQMVKNTFSPLTNPPNEQPRTIYTVPPHQGLVVSIASDSELQANVVQVVFQRPADMMITHGDSREQLKRQLYVGMLNSRLQEIQRKGTSEMLFGGVNDGVDVGGMSEYAMFAVLKQKSIKEGVALALGELYRVKNNGFTATELERQKTDLLRSYETSYNERDKTESANYVGEYTRNFLHKEAYPGIAYEYAQAKKMAPTVTLAEVNALTQKLMVDAAPVMMLSVKQKVGMTVPTEAELRHVYDSVKGANFAAYEDKVMNAPLMAKKPTSGKVTGTKLIADLGVTEWTLSNGAKVVIKPTDFKNDEVLFSASSPGGNSLASNNDLLSATFAAAIVDQSGIGNFDETTLEKALSGKIANVSPSIGGLSEGFSGSAAPKDLETMFQLAYLYATSPRFDKDAFESQIHKLESSVENKANSPDAAFSDTVSTTLTQYNPRALPLTTDRINQISLDKIKTFYQDRFADFSDFTFFIVGNVDLKTLRPMVETYLASLPSTGRKETWKDDGIRPPSGQISKAVYKGIEPKSNVVMVISGPFDYTAKNRFVIQSMAAVLSIKLRETLREEKSGVYGVGVSARPVHYPESRYQLVVGFGCAPDRVDELVKAVMEKLDTATMKPPEEIYLTKVKETEKKELEVNLKLNRYWASALSQAYTNNEDPHIATARKEFIESLTANDIFVASKQYLNKANMAKFVLYPERKN